MAYITKDQLLELIDEAAPFSTAEEWDNVGLLVGSSKDCYRKVMGALELSEDVVRQAVEAGADVIVTHHPIMLAPIKRLDGSDGQSRCIMELIRNDIAHIAAHTNLDASEIGTNAQLAQKLRLKNLKPLPSLMGRVGELEQPLTLLALAEKVDRVLGFGSVRIAGDAETPICRVAVVTGSGMSLAEEAAEAGAQALITGDVRHHNAAEAVGRGLCVVDAGHFETEQPAISGVIECLQSRYHELQCSVADSKMTEFCLAREGSVLRPLRKNFC